MQFASEAYRPSPDLYYQDYWEGDIDIDIDTTSVELWKSKRALTETRDVADECCYCGARKISSFNKFYFSIFSRLFQKSSLTLTRHF